MGSKIIWRQKMIKLTYITFSLLLVFCGTGYGQSAKALIREGNKQYKAQKFNESELSYWKSLEKNKSSVKGVFNLGDALYQQKKYDQASARFQSVIAKEKDKEVLAQAYHNLGNALLEEKKLEESIEAYKNALRRAPADADTKYNLAYAQELLRKQQKQQQQKEQQQKEDDQQKGGSKQEKEKQQQNQQQQQKQPQDESQNLSKEDAQRMLEALNNREKEIQEKKKAKMESGRMRIEKDW
jgi:Ca-activated chloride channel homolog